MIKTLEKSKSFEIHNKRNSKIKENEKDNDRDNDNSTMMISQIKDIFNHYSKNTQYLSNKQYKLFLIEASLLDDILLTPEYSNSLFYSFSYAKDFITFNSFFDLLMKIVNIKFPENSKLNPKKTLSLFFDTYIHPLISIHQSPKTNKSKKNIFQRKNVNNELSFNDINHKLIISKISSILIKEIIEENYLLFLKIYQKYFCFENLKISRTQKNHLSQKAFTKVMEDFGICPIYLNAVQIEEIFDRIIDNRDYTEKIMNDFINIDLCNNDGMWFTLFHFINGVYLVAIFNVMISNYDENNTDNIWEIFIHNNDAQAFENIIKLLYKSPNLKNVMPEEIRKMQFKILNYKNKETNYSENNNNINNNNNNNSNLNEINEINKIDLNNNNNENNNNIKYNENNNDNEKENIKNKSYSNYYNNNTRQNTVKSNKSFNIYNNRFFNNEIKKNKSFNNKTNNNNKKISSIIDLSSKINGNPNELLSYVQMAPLLLKKYKKQLISVYKYYSELYLETIFSVYMTQNGFINVIKDLNLLTKTNVQINYQNLPAHQRFLIQKKRANLLNFSAVNLIFSKFSSVPGLFLKEKGKTGNKRINFINFVYIILILANKIFNPKFNNISFDDKLFSYDQLINTKFPIKNAYNFIAIYVNPLYQNILPMIEEDSFNLNNFKILLENDRLNILANIIFPLFIRILKCYNDNKDYIEYSQYFKCLSDFNIFPDFVQRTKMIKIFINFIDDFDDIFLLQGNNKIISKIESCAYGLLYIGLGANDTGSIISDDFEIKLLNFIQRIAQSDNLGKISILNLKNTLQKDFLNAFYEIQSFILGDNQNSIPK